MSTDGGGNNNNNNIINMSQPQPSNNAAIAPGSNVTAAAPHKSFSPATEEILKRLPQNSRSSVPVPGTSEWEAAREAVLKNMTTSDSFTATESTSKPTSDVDMAPKPTSHVGMTPKPTSHVEMTPKPTSHVEMTPKPTSQIDIAVEQDSLMPDADQDTIVVVQPGIDTSTPARGVRGRGRGGRPRGRGRGRGRGAAISAAAVTTPAFAPSATPTSARGGRGRGRGRGGRPRGRGGRKPLAEGIKIGEVSSDSEDDQDEGETHFATTSRSGRAITKPTTFVPVIPSPTLGVKRKRNWGRRNPDLAVCKACLRPHSPATNMIVFCDGCNTPYHRYCHHPPISQEVVDVPDMEWFCLQCSVEVAPHVDVSTFVPANTLTHDSKREALSMLPTKTLVDLLLAAEKLHPSLSIFPPGAHNSPLPTTLADLLTAAEPMNPSTAPSNPILDEHSPSLHYPIPVRPEDDVDTYDDYDNPTANYPKPGQGLAALLPPEQDHLDWLVDDNHDAYSHMWPGVEKVSSALVRDKLNGHHDATMAGAHQETLV